MTEAGESQLLCAWERGAGQSNPARALLLLGACLNEGDDAQLSSMTIGARDARLLDLRERLFGPHVRCLAPCAACDDTLELNFRIGDVRAAHATNHAVYSIEAHEHLVRFRLPDSSDLLQVCGTDGARAERKLLERCIVAACSAGQSLEATSLPERVVTAITERMGELDAQADVVLSVSCPACGRDGEQVFDISSFLWTELDAWARRTLQDVHELALAYGWSEAAILSMSPSRRDVYLQLLDGVQ